MSEGENGRKFVGILNKALHKRQDMGKGIRRVFDSVNHGVNDEVDAEAKGHGGTLGTLRQPWNKPSLGTSAKESDVTTQPDSGNGASRTIRETAGIYDGRRQNSIIPCYLLCSRPIHWPCAVQPRNPAPPWSRLARPPSLFWLQPRQPAAFVLQTYISASPPPVSQ
ncbi:conserved hypothetical protein [Histoplasma capsulatum H143]|uniref:Uncharacterized protein n=1 Tax=Ajellomyces capsulatus (strain H143) TaxID=544712 RepID=C6HPF1_AJECH|nr:conserved hypothetical protein [Histoplasma capsulatum H143]